MVRGKKGRRLFKINGIYNTGQYLYFENGISSTPFFWPSFDHFLKMASVRCHV